MDEGRKYRTKAEFRKKCSGAYHSAVQSGIISRMDWFDINARGNRFTDNVYSVYAYIDYSNKAVYIGLTCNKGQRDYDHRRNLRSAVYRYFKNTDMDIPDPVIMFDGITMEEAQSNEDSLVKHYKDIGWNVLNTGKTGIGVGSVGKVHKKWTRNKVLEISRKFTTRSEFQRQAGSAYREARKMNLLDQMTWLEKPESVKWTYDNIMSESRKYSSRTEFFKNNRYVYNLARMKNLLDSMAWLEDKTTRWSKEDVFRTAMAYSRKGDFKRDKPFLYHKCLKMKWIQEMTWFI